MSETVIGTLLAAAIASLGYVVRLIVQEWREWRDRRAARLSDLLALHALLRASSTAFTVQNELARDLARSLRSTFEDSPDTAVRSGYEAVLSHYFDRMSPEQADTHGIIRAYTQHALRPLNLQMSAWLRNDTDYRFADQHRWRRESNAPRAQLAESLADLDAHLLLWHAKYEAWIPDQPAHALVYLADEGQHGLGFPRRVETDVAAVLSVSGASPTQAPKK